MYYLHNLRSNLQEWKNRLYRVPFEDFGYELRDFFQKIEKEKVLLGILKDTTISYSFDDPYLENWIDESYYDRPEFTSKEHQTAILYQFWTFAIRKWEIKNLLNYTCFYGDNVQSETIEKFITPLVNYLHDKLDDSNSITFLLEKYKRRTEWFFGNDLIEKYRNATKSYEQIFEDDLRLYLFDQGIDYPFSTPKSTSGRADIIGQIDTSDPLILEVKVIDLNKSYGKQRIVDGFSQCVKYANDYNKNVSYLAIFNTSPKEILFNFNDANKYFPPKLIVGNKTFFFIVINLNNEISASKIGKTDFIEVKESDLI